METKKENLDEISPEERYRICKEKHLAKSSEERFKIYWGYDIEYALGRVLEALNYVKGQNSLEQLFSLKEMIITICNGERKHGFYFDDLERFSAVFKCLKELVYITSYQEKERAKYYDFVYGGDFDDDSLEEKIQSLLEGIASKNNRKGWEDFITTMLSGYINPSMMPNPNSKTVAEWMDLMYFIVDYLSDLQKCVPALRKYVSQKKSERKALKDAETIDNKDQNPIKDAA